MEKQSKKEYSSGNLEMRFHSQTTQRRRHKWIGSSENTEIHTSLCLQKNWQCHVLKETDIPWGCEKYWSVKRVVFYLLLERLQLHSWVYFEEDSQLKRGTHKKNQRSGKTDLWQKTKNWVIKVGGKEFQVMAIQITGSSCKKEIICSLHKGKIGKRQ